MKKYRCLCLLFALFGAGLLSAVEAEAASARKSGALKGKVAAKPKKMTQAQQAEEAKRAAEAKAQAEQEAALRAEQEAKAKAEAEAKNQAEAKVRAEAEAAKQAEIEAREKPLREADELIKNGKPADAYALLESLEFERSGEVRFDYLLGIAALDSGKSDKATLAFERVLAVDPNFAGARLDMARAYFQLGDLPRAKTEFEAVLKLNPPEAARATIQKYLVAIAAQDQARKTRITGYVEGVVGHDSNVNSATSQGQVALPALGNLVFTLSSANVKAPDDYIGLAGGLDILHPVNETVALYAGLDIHRRGNMAVLAMDSVSQDEQAGVMFTLGKQDSLRAGVQFGQYDLGGVRNRDSLGFNGEWRHVFSPANQSTLFAQQVKYRFASSAQDTQNFDLEVMGGSWVHILPDGKTSVFASLFWGGELDVAPASPANPAGGRGDGRKHFTGVRVGAQAALNEKTELFASAAWTDGGYDRLNSIFLKNRHDTLDDYALGLNWRRDKFWSVRPQLSVTYNRSNIDIYKYDRIGASVAVRRDFN